MGHHGAMRITLALILGLLLAQVARAEPDSFGLGSGRDGVLTVVKGSVAFISDAAPLKQSVAAGALALTVPGLKVGAGDLVMIHTSIGLLPAPVLGSAKAVALDATVVGRWELARLGAVDATTGVLKLTQSLRFAYAATRSQVLRVPEYSDVIVEAGGRLSVTPWDGRSGGILAMLVSGKLVNDGTIDADGAGFRGGTFLNHPVIMGCTGFAVAEADGGAARGEGVAGTVSGGGG
ncbi:hemagglutinin, partial [Corallococcus llansteffanensis]